MEHLDIDNNALIAFGQILKSARESRGLSRRELGEIVGIPPRNIIYIENEGKSITIQNLCKLAKFLEISVDTYLLSLPERSGYSNVRNQLDSVLYTLSIMSP